VDISVPRFFGVSRVDAMADDEHEDDDWVYIGGDSSVEHKF